MPNTAVTVTTSSGVLIAKNSNRIGLIIENDSGGSIFIGDASTITTSTGTTLATGSTREFFPSHDKSQFFYRGDIYAIAGSSLTVRVWEITTQRG
jgi:hypothetical protein